MGSQEQVSLRILAFDHFYHQDLAAIREGLNTADELFVLGYRRLHRLAEGVFPPEAFVGVHRAMDDDMACQREAWEIEAQRFAHWMNAAYRPNVFVVPSDVFFYLRPVIRAFKELGVPTAVVQKETTISPMTMVDHAEEIRTTVPFMSDIMTVCSERHREFWLNCGTDGDLVHVTGQPRFDLYAAKRPSRLAGTKPKLLYLSYDDTAYLPSGVSGDSPTSWRTLRRETEETLFGLADRFEITVKEHPQQRNECDWLGNRTTRTDRSDDTRELIAATDIVVGFQTTTLFEAALAKKPIVYAAWGDAYNMARSDLVPFEAEHGMLNHVHSAGELAELLSRPLDEIPTPTAASLDAVAEHLGPTDGAATDRVLDHLRRLASAGVVTDPSRRQLATNTALGLTGRVGFLVAAPLGRVSERYGAAVSRRSKEFIQAGAEATLIRSN